MMIPCLVQTRMENLFAIIALSLRLSAIYDCIASLASSLKCRVMGTCNAHSRPDHNLLENRIQIYDTCCWGLSNNDRYDT